MKKKVIFPAILILSFFSLSNSADYYPVGEGYSWVYGGYMKANPQKITTIKANIAGIEMKDGREYYYFSAPSVDVRYFVRTDNQWAYMKVIKYPFPVLKFLTVDVTLYPEVRFAKFPYTVGDKWQQESVAEADLFPFKLKTKIKCRFEVMDSEKYMLNGREYEVYRVRMERDEGNNNIRIEDNWFAEGLGFVRGNTPEYYMEMQMVNAPEQ